MRKFIYKTSKITMILIFLLSGISNVVAQVRSQSFSDLFQDNELINIRLESDFKSVFKSKDDSTNFKALLSYLNSHGEKENIEVEIRSRGEQRKKQCSFKPIRIEFKKKAVKGTIFEKQSAIKLVTHCRKLKEYEQNTILEYLTYRALNILTDTSFRVRPLMVNYVYDGKKKDSVQKFGFMIERFKYMAERLHMKTFHHDHFHPLRTNIDHMNLIDIFQFMIGNTDYSVLKSHNSKLIINADENTILAVPFDFDWCGLVAPTYAVPNDILNIESVEERVYRGYELDPLKLQKVFDRFNAKRDEILNLFKNETRLDDKEKKRVVDYIELFYSVINEEGAAKEFVKVSRSVDRL